MVKSVNKCFVSSPLGGNQVARVLPFPVISVKRKPIGTLAKLTFINI